MSEHVAVLGSGLVGSAWALVFACSREATPARQAWRDRRLMALATHLNRARTEIGS